MPTSTHKPSRGPSEQAGDRPLTESDLQRMPRTPQVKIIRRALGLTQDEFAARYRVPLGTLRDWEHGLSEPDTTTTAYLRVIAAEPARTAQALDRHPGRATPDDVDEVAVHRKRSIPMAGKTTSSKTATAASKTLRSAATAPKSKSAAGSALSQKEQRNTKSTSTSAASNASKALGDGRSSKTTKSAAGSALSQKK